MKEALLACTRSLLLTGSILISSAVQVLAYYHPDEGRWISRDPIGQRGERNPYAFCVNRPTDRIDPDGRYSTCCCKGVILADRKINSLVRKVTWTAAEQDPQSGRRPEHVWVTWPDGSVDANGGEWLGLFPDDEIRVPALGNVDPFYKIPEPTYAAEFLSPCEYDFVALWKCLTERARQLKGTKYRIRSGCHEFADEIVSECEKKSKGCTIPADIPSTGGVPGAR